MIKTVFGLFLFLNSILGYGFYEGTAFGDFLAQSEWYGVTFFALNFIGSHMLVLLFGIPGLEWISLILLKALWALFLIAVGLFIPYLFVFEWFGWSGMFAVVVYLLVAITIIAGILGPVMRSLLDTLKKLTDAFFDGLKRSAIENALARAKKEPDVLPPIVKKQIELGKLAKEFEDMIDNDQFFKKHR
jgi:small-conductance mechanosensitive channel